MANEWLRIDRSIAQRGRSAFTLLEVVLSLSLSVILMAALLSTVDLYRQISTTGREQVARAQLARAILRQMEIDIRGCRFSANDESMSVDAEEEAGGASPGESSEAGGTASTEISADSYTENVGIMGDASTLLVQMSRAPRPIDAYRQSGGFHVGDSTSDLCSVAYFLAGSGATGLGGAAASLLVSDSLSTGSNTPVGLARLAGDPVALESMDASADVQSLVTRTQLVADEVKGLSFRYFDGIEWFDAWDSAERQGLPAAIEITLSVSLSTGEQSEANAEVYRMVVALAAAEPVDTGNDLISF